LHPPTIPGDGLAHYYRVVAHTASGDVLSTAVGKVAHRLYPGYDKVRVLSTSADRVLLVSPWPLGMAISMTNNRPRTVREKRRALRRGMLSAMGNLRLDQTGPRPKAIDEEIGDLPNPRHSQGMAGRRSPRTPRTSPGVGSATMFRLTTITIAMSLAALLSPGCDKKDDKKGDDKSAKAGDAEAGDAEAVDAEAGDAEAAPPALAFKKLDKFGLEIEVPSDVEVMDGAGESISIFNNDIKVDLALVGDAHPSDIAAAKKSIEMDPNKLKSFTKEVEMEGGWHLEYELSSMMDPTKTLYGVNIRKTFGDKQYACTRNVDSAATRDAIAKACLSLKPAG